MTALHHRSRAGFTLIELLVVIAILAVLSAIGVGTYFRVRGSSEVKANETTVAKLSTGLNQQWSAERDTAEKEFKDNTYGNVITTLTNFAAGDRDRAKALWMHLRMKNTFPQTFLEAMTTTNFTPTGLPTYNTFLPIRPTFSATDGLKYVTSLNLPRIEPANAADVNEPNTQAAVLLHLMLTQRAGRGAAFSDEAAGSLTKTVRFKIKDATNVDQIYDFKVYSDTFGTPLTYVRWATNPEIDAAPFVKPNQGKDPFDPLKRLSAGGGWTIQPATPVSSAAAGAGFGLAPLNVFNTNWLPTIVCAGANKNWDGLNVNAGGLVNVPPDTDNILGYRLRREGERGN